MAVIIPEARTQIEFIRTEGAAGTSIETVGRAEVEVGALGSRNS
jgi:hypothetical protein